MRVPVALATLCLAGAFALPMAAQAQPDPNQPPPGAMAPQGGPGVGPGGAMTPPPPGMEGGAMMGPGAGPGAGPGQHLKGRARFDAANTTHDGRLTPDQAQAAGWRAIAVHFQEIDSDHKGYVTWQDVRAWQQARRAAKAAGGGAMAPQGGPPPGPPPNGQQY